MRVDVGSVLFGYGAVFDRPCTRLLLTRCDHASMAIAERFGRFRGSDVWVADEFAVRFLLVLVTNSF